MEIRCANLEQLELVTRITQITISEIYPHYYAQGAVDFFLLHHSTSQISADIQSGQVFLIYDDGKMPVGTVTLKENHICRLFILPEFQKKGYGRKLLDYAENRLFEHYDTIQLEASLPAKSIYLNRGYAVTQAHSICTQNGDYLCYDVMQKKRSHNIFS